MDSGGGVGGEWKWFSLNWAWQFKWIWGLQANFWQLMCNICPEPCRFSLWLNGFALAESDAFINTFMPIYLHVIKCNKRVCKAKINHFLLLLIMKSDGFSAILWGESEHNFPNLNKNNSNKSALSYKSKFNHSYLILNWFCSQIYS